MNPSAWSLSWVPAVAIAALACIALGTATFGARTSAPAVAAQRPAADAPVNVVRAPASAATGKAPCRTCTLGAGRSWL